MQQTIMSIDKKSSNAERNIEKISAELNKQLATFEGIDDIRESLAAKTKQLTQPNLTIHAIIPGRAWLKKPNGEIITVNEGDSIERYGKILAIHPQNGSISTSSGTTLSR